MSYKGADVSRYQDPAALPWGEWVAGGLTVACVQLMHGDTPEPHAAGHVANAAEAHVPCLGAYAFLIPGNARQQALAFTSSMYIYSNNPFQFCAVDVEAEPGQEPPSTADLLEWIDAFMSDCKLPLVLYGNNALAAIVAAYPELRRYGVWWAAYPTYPNLITNPPAGKPNVPAGLNVIGWQYGGNNGRLPPYDGAIDLTTWFQLPDGEQPMTISPGAGHGFHGEQTNQIIPIIKRGLQLGIKYKLLNSIENPGRCKDAHDLLPDMATICRFKGPHTQVGERWENGQDVETWTEQEHLDCARAQIQILFDRTNSTERAGIKFYTPMINEWNLTGDLADWTCVGHHLHLMMDEAERRSGEFGQVIRLAVPGISQGKPQYWQMQQMVATGCFDRMADRGDLFTVHEGRYRWETGDAIPGLGEVIPRAPRCPPYGGSGTGRINYWYDLGIKCDFAVAECYDGLSSATPPVIRFPRMKQTDDLYRHNKHYAGTAWFEEVDNDDSPWRDTDFTPTMQSDVFEQEMIREARVANPTGDNEMSPLFHAKALIDLMLRDAAGNPATDPLAQSPDGHVVLKGTTLHVYATGVTAGGYSNRVTVTADGKSVWGIAAALERV